MMTFTKNRNFDTDYNGFWRPYGIQHIPTIKGVPQTRYLFPDNWRVTNQGQIAGYEPPEGIVKETMNL